MGEENKILRFLNERMNLMGISKMKLAEEVGATRSSITNFLNGKTSLRIDYLNEIFIKLGFDVSLFGRKGKMAQKVADIIYKNKIDIQNENKQFCIDKILFYSKETLLNKLREYVDEEQMSKEGFEYINLLHDYFIWEEESIVSNEDSYCYFLAIVIILLQSKIDKSKADTMSRSCQKVIDVIPKYSIGYCQKVIDVISKYSIGYKLDISAFPDYGKIVSIAFHLDMLTFGYNFPDDVNQLIEELIEELIEDEEATEYFIGACKQKIEKYKSKNKIYKELSFNGSGLDDQFLNIAMAREKVEFKEEFKKEFKEEFKKVFTDIHGEEKKYSPHVCKKVEGLLKEIENKTENMWNKSENHKTILMWLSILGYVVSVSICKRKGVF
jgi:transcriptional regulator with XRE-family HTH domain